MEGAMSERINTCIKSLKQAIPGNDRIPLGCKT